MPPRQSILFSRLRTPNLVHRSKRPRSYSLPVKTLRMTPRARSFPAFPLPSNPFSLSKAPISLKVPFRSLHDRECIRPGSLVWTLLARARDDHDPDKIQSTDDDRPVTSQAVLIHCMHALNRLRVIATDNPYPAWGSAKRPTNRIDAGSTHNESFHLSPRSPNHFGLVPSLAGRLPERPFFA